MQLKPLKRRLNAQQLARRAARNRRRVNGEEPVRFMRFGASKPHKGKSWPRHQGARECARRRRQLAAQH